MDNIWNTRQASAHVVVDPAGEWGQAVYDRDTAWANASAWANARTIAIEHSNNTGRFGGNDYHDKSWNISNETLISGARVAAAYCLHEKLGPPVYGRSIRDHNEFTSTGCPVHLQGPRAGNAWGGKAGKYHHAWMEEAVWFYEQLEKRLVHPDGAPITTKFPAPKEEEFTVAEADRVIDFIKNYVGPIGSDTKDNRAQLTGARDNVPGDLAKSYPGWDLARLLASAREKQFTGLTLVEMCAVAIGGTHNDHAAARAAANPKEK
ncbi:hypothetical protein BFG51_02610 [Dietzia alimentaria]|nr:hypothetical protein BFG51_02610 [Dietzia alimentaria]